MTSANLIKKIKSWGIFLVFCVCVFLSVIYFWGGNLYPQENYLAEREDKKISDHIKKPDEVRGIYITAFSAGIPRFDDLIKFVKDNNLNSVVLDIKGPYGEPAFPLKHEQLKKYSWTKTIYDLDSAITRLHRNGIYAIARLPVFQDPYLVEREPSYALQWKGGGIWHDYKGVRWLDPTIFDIWKYNATLAREAYERGFDEIQLDYVRFPSDGNLEGIKYANWNGETKKEEEIEKFFSYMGKIMRREKIPFSGDLFGLVCCMENYDLGIGQVLERALPYFDFVSPMMYPSHYSAGFVGRANPASYPYEVIKYSMEKANKKIENFRASATMPLARLRPWIQDFDLGDNYDATKVLAQIRAAREEGAEGFLIWNARNVYTPLGKGW